MRHVEEWIAGSTYCAALGIEAESVGEQSCVLRLPFLQANANPGGALHGGVAASLSACASQAVARVALGAESGPWHIADMQINYLSAVSGEGVIAEGRLLRNGRDLCYVAVAIRGQSGTPVASAITLVRGRLGAAATRLPVGRIIVPKTGPAPMAERLARGGFISSRGIRLVYQHDGSCAAQMPWQDSNGAADGGLHDGAMLALLDTTGAMACFTQTGVTAGRASTPSIQAQVLAPLPRADVEARARVAFRDGDLFWSDVEVVVAGKDEVLARGTVVYRIVPPK